MSIETKSMHITPVGGNVFVDLGFDLEKAAEMQAESQRIIADKQTRKDCHTSAPIRRIEPKRPK